MRVRVSGSGLLWVSLLAMGCAVPPRASEPAPVIRPSEALVLQDGIEIVGLEPEALRKGGVHRPSQYGLPVLFEADARYADAVERFRASGRAVRVTVPGRDEPLYGLLSFHALPDGATGPATRSYAISVPQTYVDQATGGRISVVYELVRVTRTERAQASMMARSTATVRTQNSDWIAWILFLSDRPI